MTRMHLSGKPLYVAMLGLLLLIVIFDALVSFRAGKQSNSAVNAIKTTVSHEMRTNNASPKDGRTYGPNVNFGSFTLAGTVVATTNNGVIMQTTDGNVMGILYDQHTVIVNPSGKNITESNIVKNNVISVVSRVNSGGQFIALRVIQE